MRRGLLILAGGLLLSSNTAAQPEWEVSFPHVDGVSVSDLHDAMPTAGGGALVLVNDRGTTSARLIEVDMNGAVIGEGSLLVEGRLADPYVIMGRQPNGDWLVAGGVGPEVFAAGDSTYPALFRSGSDLSLLSVASGGRPGRSLGEYRAATDEDGNIRMAYTSAVPSFSHQEVLGVTFAPDGTILDTAVLHGWEAIPNMGGLSLLPNGGHLLATSSWPWLGIPNPQVSMTYAVEFDAAWNRVDVVAMPLADPQSQHPEGGLYWPLYSLLLPGGDLMLSGVYRPIDAGQGFRSALQRVTRQGELVGQWAIDSPYLKETPARIRGMDLAPDGTVHYVQMNFEFFNSWTGGGQPSQLQLVHLDTAFNVLGGYLFDGVADGDYYYPSIVRATPDGGVLVGGIKRELSATPSRSEAWLARFTTAGLTAGIATRQRKEMGIFPNPGREVIGITLADPVYNAWLEVYDPQGRSMARHMVQGTHARLAASELPQGAYMLLLRDMSGRVIATGRWLKM